MNNTGTRIAGNIDQLMGRHSLDWRVGLRHEFGRTNTLHGLYNVCYTSIFRVHANTLVPLLSCVAILAVHSRPESVAIYTREGSGLVRRGYIVRFSVECGMSPELNYYCPSGTCVSCWAPVCSEPMVRRTLRHLRPPHGLLTPPDRRTAPSAAQDAQSDILDQASAKHDAVVL